MKKLQWEILRQSANKEWKHKQQQTPASEEINKNGAQREKELKLKSNQIKSFQQLMLINGNHQTECVCLSLICLATNWTHQYQCWQHCCSCCCSCWKRCASNVKVTDRSEQGAPLSQGAERFAAHVLQGLILSSPNQPIATWLFTCSRWTFPAYEALYAAHLSDFRVLFSYK